MPHERSGSFPTVTLVQRISLARAVKKKLKVKKVRKRIIKARRRQSLAREVVERLRNVLETMASFVMKLENSLMSTKMRTLRGRIEEVMTMMTVKMMMTMT